MNTYAVTVTRDGRWWMVAVPEIDGLTQARRIDDIPRAAEELIAVTTATPITDIAVTISYQPIHGIDITAAADSIKADRQLLRTVSDRLATEQQQLAKALTARGIPIRDIGAMLGVSYQRAQQLAST